MVMYSMFFSARAAYIERGDQLPCRNYSRTTFLSINQVARLTALTG